MDCGSELVRRRGLEPLCRFRAPAPQAGASANFATSARGELSEYIKEKGEIARGRTCPYPQPEWRGRSDKSARFRRLKPVSAGWPIPEMTGHWISSRCQNQPVPGPLPHTGVVLSCSGAVACRSRDDGCDYLSARHLSVVPFFGMLYTPLLLVMMAERILFAGFLTAGVLTRKTPRILRNMMQMASLSILRGATVRIRPPAFALRRQRLDGALQCNLLHCCFAFGAPLGYDAEA